MADKKITELTANTTPITTDLAVMVDDPAGTPATQKITLLNLLPFYGALADYVATSQTTASTSYTDLATTGPAVTVTIGSHGMAVVILFNACASDTATANQHMGFAVSGASTVAAADEWSNQVRQVDANVAGFERQSAVFLVTGLTAGSNTFTAKYKVNAGTGTFKERRIAVVPL